MIDWEKKITALMKQMNCNVSQLESKLGVGNGYINGIKTGKNKHPAKLIDGLIQKFRINPKWLEDDTVPIFQEDIKQSTDSISVAISTLIKADTAPKFAEHDNRMSKIEAELKQLRSLYEESVKIKTDMLQEPEPSYGAADDSYEELEETIDLPLAFNLAAGIPVEAVESTETYPVPVKLIPRKNRTYCVAKIAGTSMTLADIPDGSYVLLEYTSEPIQGEYMVVQYGENTTLKLLHQTEHGRWELLYCDGSEAKIELKEGRWEVKGRFIAVLPKKA